jgi:hypothetical protein
LPKSRILWKEIFHFYTIINYNLNNYNMQNEQEYMLLFRLEPSEQQPTPEQLAEMGQTWGAYFGELAMKGLMVSTHQLGYEGIQIYADHSITQGINIASGLTLGGNLIVKASSMDQAMEIGKKCPILLMGGTVEVRTILPM